MAEKVAEKNVLAIVGSLRKASVNRQLAEAAAEHAPAGVSVTIYEGLADLPHYNEDIDGESAPAAAEALRAAVAGADAVLLVSPENNGTISSSLKNAIDWLSRPFGSSVFKGKPTVVIGTRRAAMAASGRSMRPARRLGSRPPTCSKTSSSPCRRRRSMASTRVSMPRRSLS